MAEPAPRKQNIFRHRHRLHGQRAFDAVFDARCRKNHGPLSVLSRPNDLPYNRLGLAVPRRVGNAVKRHRIKRMLREAFRLTLNEGPQGYDMVVVVRAHPSATLDAYQQWLADAMKTTHHQWQRRRERTERRDAPGPPGSPTAPPSQES